MRLATEADVHIVLCSQLFTLRATLRAAFCLNLKYRGFAKLAKAIQEGQFGAYQDVITAGCNDPAFLKPFNAPDADVSPLGEAILGSRHELLEFVAVLAGAAGTEADAKPAGKPISFEDYHTRLYQFGTGWLGWTPEDTWEAKPSEILNAYEGRLDMLKALFGTREDGTTIDASAGELTADMRAELNAMGRARGGR
ncbi:MULTISPECIES: hypothetical protein [unclassified Bradyrhizobium]|uniref:hypothetical protein n=1 Tax=unclassified Bradyrhizobium TaxID=2631580 RepID=UPI002916CFA7|nr:MULTISPECIES: hypothetical protein [unclassified Bradyrhizobium]